MTTQDPPGAHLHTLELTSSEVAELKSGKRVTVVTSTNAGHNHEMTLYYNAKYNVGK